jgi:hypothetical protein
MKRIGGVTVTIRQIRVGEQKGRLGKRLTLGSLSVRVCACLVALISISARRIP